MSGPTDARLKFFIDRVLRLKEEQDALADDIREVYAEAKGEGFDKTAMGEVVAYLRKIEKKGRDAVDERGAIFDLYLSTYEASGMDRATHTHAPASYSEAKGREPVQGMHEFDPEPEATTSRPEAVANSAADIDTPATENGFADDVGATASSTYSPETATEPPHHLEPTRGDGAAMASSHKEGATGRQPVDTLRAGRTGSETVTVVGDESGTLTSSHSQAAPPPADTADAAQSSLAASATHADESYVPDFLRKPVALRPDCRHPDNCAGYGAHTCHACKAAASARESVEA